MFKRTLISALCITGLLAAMAAAQAPGVDSSGAIVGTVYDSATGNPLQNAQVILSVFLIQGEAIDTVVTGADGAYAFTHLVTGLRTNYGLQVSLQNYRPEMQTGVRLSSGQTDTVDFTLAPVSDTLTPQIGTGTLSGAVYDSAAGTPLQNALVVLSSGFGPLGQVMDSAVTGATGQYLFENINIGIRTIFTVSVTASNYAPQSQSSHFLSDANPSDTVDFYLVKMDTANSWLVYGAVTADSAGGTPLAGALVEIKQAVGSELRYSAKTGQNGEYAILIPMQSMLYEINASLAGYQKTALQQRISGDSTQINLVLETDTTGISIEGNTNGTGADGALSAFPNPFGASSTVALRLNNGDQAHVCVYDVSGKLIRTLAAGYKNAGEYRLRWEPNGISNGLYILKANIGNRTYIKRLLIQK